MFHSPPSSSLRGKNSPRLPCHHPSPPTALISGWTPSFSHAFEVTTVFYFYIYPLLFLVLWHRKSHLVLHLEMDLYCRSILQLCFLPNIVFLRDSSVFLHVARVYSFLLLNNIPLCRYYQNVFILLEEHWVLLGSLNYSVAMNILVGCLVHTFKNSSK